MQVIDNDPRSMNSYLGGIKGCAMSSFIVYCVSSSYNLYPRHAKME